MVTYSALLPIQFFSHFISLLSCSLQSIGWLKNAFMIEALQIACNHCIIVIDVTFLKFDLKSICSKLSSETRGACS